MQNGKPIGYASQAIVFALERFHQYTFGRRTIVHSVHKPLEMIVNKPLQKALRRLLVLMFTGTHISLEHTVYDNGKEQCIDVLHRGIYIGVAAKAPKAGVTSS